MRSTAARPGAVTGNDSDARLQPAGREGRQTGPSGDGDSYATDPAMPAAQVAQGDAPAAEGVGRRGPATGGRRPGGSPQPRQAALCGAASAGRGDSRYGKRSSTAARRRREARARPSVDGTLALAAMQWHGRAQLRGRILAGLADLARATTKGYDLPSYLQQLCATVAGVLEPPQVCLWQLDADRRRLELVAAAGSLGAQHSGRALHPRRLPASRGLAGAVLAQGTLLEALDVQDERTWRAKAAAEGVTLPHYVGVPLTAPSGAVGVLAVHTLAPTPLGTDACEALQLFGQQASLAIEQGRLVDTLRRQAAEAKRLDRIGRQLTRSLELGDMLPQVAAAARATLGADRAVVLLLNADGVSLRQAAVDGLLLPIDLVDRPRGRGLWDPVLTTRQPVVVQDVKSRRGVYRTLTDPAGIRSFIHVPIQLDDTALGILNCSWTRPRAVPADAASRLGALADQAAIAIRNAQLYAEMRAARDRLDAIWRHAGQPIMVLDRDGNVATWNPAAATLFGSPADEVLGRPTPAVPPGEWRRLWALLERAAEGDPVRAEVLTSARDGSPLPVLTTLAPLRDAAGQIDAVVAVVTDLSAQKRQEAERAQAERLHALGQLATGIAHDFNNALAHVVTRAQMLRQDYGSWSPGLSQGLETLAQTGMGAGATVRRILDFAREHPERPLTRVNLDDVVREVEQLTSPLWRAMAQARAVPIHLELGLGAPPPIMGDPAELREALINLIHNAVAAIPDGGTLTVTTGLEGERAFVSVRDTGIGMDAATQARIFEPFFTTKGAQGSGLGLSMVYGTVRRHAGEITVESAPGHGSVFTLWFPTTESRGTLAAGARPGNAVRPLRILVVDDEPALITMLARMLAIDGHEVTPCGSGAQALEQCREATFDLVLTDVCMPEMNGWELARALGESQPEVPVAFLTGWGELLDASEQAAVGVCQVLAKPFRREDLQRLVAEVAASRGLDQAAEREGGQAAAHQVEAAVDPNPDAGQTQAERAG